MARIAYALDGCGCRELHYDELVPTMLTTKIFPKMKTHERFRVELQEIWGWVKHQQQLFQALVAHFQNQWLRLMNKCAVFQDLPKGVELTWGNKLESVDK